MKDDSFVFKFSLFVVHFDLQISQKGIGIQVLLFQTVNGHCYDGYKHHKEKQNVNPYNEG